MTSFTAPQPGHSPVGQSPSRRDEAPPPPDSSAIHHSEPSRERYTVERCSGGGGRAVYEVLDKSRHVKQRVICRTNLDDATMIASALNPAVPA